MNSLHKLSGFGKKAVVALMIISTLGLAVAAQKVQPQSQGRLYGDAGFRGEPINLNVVNADIRDILNYITEQYGINFVIDKSVGAIPVTVNVSDVPWNVALDSILRAQALGVQVNGTILRIAEGKTLASEGDIIRQQKDNQLDGAPLFTEFIRLNFARATGTLSDASGGSNELSTGTSSVPSGVVYNNDSGPSTESAKKITSSGSDQGILGIIQKRLSRRGAVEVDGRSNTLIITDVRENIDAVRQLVALLDQPEPQVEIEARIVVATRNFSRDIGVQLAALVLGPRGSGAQGGTLPGGAGGSTSTAPPGLPTTTANNSLFSSLPSTVIGLTTGIFGTAQISALISAGEQKGQAKIIATPRVTTLNNRPAEIKSGTKIPITTLQPGGNGGNPIATTTYVDVPLRLQITPQITDVGSIILNVTAENSSTSAVTGGIAPAINTQSMKTEVLVPDGGTTVVGGVLFDDERENQDRTPGLSKVPLLGNLFKRKLVQRNTNEILFFITPRIYRPDLTGVPGQSGVRTSAPLIQPVPLGNPKSNSGQQPTPVEPGTAAPVKP